MKRKIPIVMATQHPDNAGEAYWLNKAFINTQDEIEECYRSFFELQCDEYMWDWEGKFADEAVIEKLLQKYFDDFKRKQLGKEIFMTLRIPNIWEEKTFKLTRAYMSILSADAMASSVKMHAPPVFEVILPMTKSADQLMHVKETFKKIANLKHDLFDGPDDGELSDIYMIPLFESADDLIDSSKVLEDYINLHEKEFARKPSYLRPFIARSDPALNAGILPAVLASKVAISEFYKIGEKHGVEMHPIIGTGGLPFRGGVNPENIESAVQEYKGIRTMTIQSAFRYDYPLMEVKNAIRYMKKTLPRLKPMIIDDEEKSEIRKLIDEDLKPPYSDTIEQAAELINSIATLIPKRRERMLHIGLFGYSRGTGKTTLPRAIKFTAAWYSLGIPPELIGTGRGLKKAQENGKLELIEKYFPTIRNEITHAGKYLNRENLELLSKKYPFLRVIKDDIKYIEEILDVELGPTKPNHMIHRNLVSTIIMKHAMGKDFSEEIIEAGKMRKNLG